MSNTNQTFPDISDLIARKIEGRKKLSDLSFAEKIQRLEVLRNRLAPLRRSGKELDTDK